MINYKPSQGLLNAIKIIILLLFVFGLFYIYISAKEKSEVSYFSGYFNSENSKASEYFKHPVKIKNSSLSIISIVRDSDILTVSLSIDTSVRIIDGKQSIFIYMNKAAISFGCDRNDKDLYDFVMNGGRIKASFQNRDKENLGTITVTRKSCES